MLRLGRDIGEGDLCMCNVCMHNNGSARSGLLRLESKAAMAQVQMVETLTIATKTLLLARAAGLGLDVKRMSRLAES